MAQTTSKAAAKAAGAPPRGRSLLSGISRLFCQLMIGLILVVVLPFAHILYMIASGAGEFGGTLAQADRLKEMYPYHFVPLCNFAAWAQSASNSYTKEYYTEQRPIVLRSAREFELHPYFAGLDASSDTWHDLIHARTRHFLAQLRESGRDDFKLEKDRCTMFSFYSRHKLPILPVHGVWRDLDQLVGAVRSGAAFANVTRWPIFWKACHLTQSSSAGTRAQHGPLDAEQLDSLVSWIRQKWEFRANDYERVWAEAGNQITQGIPPGFLLQAPMTVDRQEWRVDGRISVGLPEVRVEVVWGYAYLAVLDGTQVILRNNIVQDFSSVHTFFRSPVPVLDHWTIVEGHAECMWRVAEEAARLAGVDSIRMDIFLNRAQPSECIINENSLSSGIVYWGHEPYLTQAWAEPHRTREYKVRDTDVRVHAQ
mmetsp:Transcript_13014/g.28128  ORF Transcript_13014/g.28128 Transcript_13014/m.28128 type:complete len:425 (+) Transcript_13014:75-1349(+)